MSKLVAAAKTDAAAETGGVWVTFHAADQSEFRVKLARAGTTNPEFVKYSEELTRGIRLSGTELSRVDPAKSRDIARKLYARTIVKDWNADDFGVEFNEDNAIALFTEVDDFLNFVINESQRISNYRTAAITANAGN